MSDFVMPLPLGLDVGSLTMALVTVASPRGATSGLADSVEAALHTVGHLAVTRTGDTVVARTSGGTAERIGVVARLDTAPSGHDPLAYVEMGRLVGPGACDAKGALAVVLKVAAAGGFARDVTVVLTGGPAAREHLSDAGIVLLARPTGSAVQLIAPDSAPDRPLVRRLVELSGRPAGTAPDERADGVPTVAFGPGDPAVAGTADEFVPTAELTQCEFVLRQWLTS